MNRHDLYYRLMDISSVGLAVVFADELLHWTTDLRLFPAAAMPSFTAISLLFFLMPALLIFQRWMRDDFSEMLWQRTAGTVLKWLIVLPIPVAIAAGFYIADGGLNDALSIMNEVVPGHPKETAMTIGVVYSAVYLWFAVPVVFTATFQWHRWRASR